MADRFSRGPQQQFQFQATPLNELLAVPMMNQQIYDRNQQAMTEELSRIGSQVVRAEDYNTRKSIVDDLSKKFDDASAKNNGDLAAISDEMYSAIQKQRASGKMTQLADVYKRSEENRQIQDKMRAQGIPFFDKGNAANQALFNADGTMNDLRYETVGYEKDYRPHKEQYMNNMKPSDLGNNFGSLVETYKKAGGDMANMPAFQRFIQSEGIQLSGSQKQEISNNYLSSGYGQSEVDMMMNLQGMTKDEAEQAVKNSFNSVFSEREYIQNKSQLIDNRGMIQSARKLQDEANGPVIANTGITSTKAKYGTFENVVDKMKSKNPKTRREATAAYNAHMNRLKENPEYQAAVKTKPKVTGTKNNEIKRLINDTVDQHGFKTLMSNPLTNVNDFRSFRDELTDKLMTYHGVDPMDASSVGNNGITWSEVRQQGIQLSKDNFDNFDDWHSDNRDVMLGAKEEFRANDILLETADEYPVPPGTKNMAGYKNMVKSVSPQNYDISFDSVDGDLEEAIEEEGGFNPSMIQNVLAVVDTGNGGLKLEVKVGSGSDAKTGVVYAENKTFRPNDSFHQVAKTTGMDNKGQWTQEHSYRELYPDSESLSEKFGVEYPVMVQRGQGIYVDDGYKTYNELLTELSSVPGNERNVAILYEQAKLNGGNSIYKPKSSSEAGIILESYMNALNR